MFCIVATLQESRHAELGEYVSRVDDLPLETKYRNLQFYAEIEHAKKQAINIFRIAVLKEKKASKSMHRFYHQNPSNRNPQNISHSQGREMSVIILKNIYLKMVYIYIDTSFRDTYTNTII